MLGSLKKLLHIPTCYLIFVTLWLRFVNLGYSDYQGDEIKALFRPDPGQSLLDFLFAQRKGPTQFLITYLIKFVDASYRNRFLLRLPFALAGALSVYYFFKFVNLHFGKKIAFLSSALFSVNGLIVAFSRIVQYQLFAVLFFTLALYFFSLAVKSSRWNRSGLYLGMFFWGLSALTHYDAVFILPFVLYLLAKWWIKNRSMRTSKRLLAILSSGAVCALILAVFYVPYGLSISESTVSYWLDRIVGGDDKISSSVVTFKIYNPTIILFMYISLGILSLLKLKKTFFVVLWFLFPWVILECLVQVPGTHIYGYLIPATIMVSFGMTVVEDAVLRAFKPRVGNPIRVVGISVVLVFVFLLSHTVFVDHNPEYPWENKRFLIWELQRPDTRFHLLIFGFPYYRHWDEIGMYVSALGDRESYSTNERRSLTRYHISLPEDLNNSDIYVHILNPQSFENEIRQEKARYWSASYDPDVTFQNGGRVVSEIYSMPKGDLDTIVAMGY